MFCGELRGRLGKEFDVIIFSLFLFNRDIFILIFPSEDPFNPHILLLLNVDYVFRFSHMILIYYLKFYHSILFSIPK